MLWSRNARSLRSARWLRETRLELFRLLVTCGPEGLRAGVIAERPGVQPSSLSFHLAQLTHAGLITQRSLSRQLIYSADYGAMTELLGDINETATRFAREAVDRGASFRQYERRPGAGVLCRRYHRGHHHAARRLARLSGNRAHLDLHLQGQDG